MKVRYAQHSHGPYCTLRRTLHLNRTVHGMHCTLQAQAPVLEATATLDVNANSEQKEESKQNRESPLPIKPEKQNRNHMQIVGWFWFQSPSSAVNTSSYQYPTLAAGLLSAFSLCCMILTWPLCHCAFIKHNKPAPTSLGAQSFQYTNQRYIRCRRSFDGARR
jgi:hypothetical protein